MTRSYPFRDELDLSSLIEMQVESDRLTGAVGIEEACCPEFNPDETLLKNLDFEDQERIVAIAAIINTLLEMADHILQPE